MTSHPLGVDSNEHELIIGSSFRGGNSAFHSLRYDFKPASVDTTQPAVFDIGENNLVTVTIPHVEKSGKTIYKGNKRALQKDCVLIIDHETGNITLEKLSYNIALKKTRAERTTPLVAPVTQPPRLNAKLKKPLKKPDNKPGQSKAGATTTSAAPATNSGPPTPTSTSEMDHTSSAPSIGGATVSALFDTSSDSDDDADMQPVSSYCPPASAPQPKIPGPSPPPVSLVNSASSTAESNRDPFMSTLSQDLLLSESSSDSD